MSDFVKVLARSQLGPGRTAIVEAAGRRIALCNTDGEIFALDNACAHRGGPLGEGDLNGKELVCPWHGWGFDVFTGCAVHTAAQVRTYPVKVEGDDILVCV